MYSGQPFVILQSSCDIVTYRLNWPRGWFAHAYVLYRLYLYILLSLTMSLRLSTAIKKLLWTMTLYLTTNCYYVLFSQQHLGKNTESWKWSVYRPFVGIPTTVAALDLTYWWSFIEKGLRLQPAQQACFNSGLLREAIKKSVFLLDIVQKWPRPPPPSFWTPVR